MHANPLTTPLSALPKRITCLVECDFPLYSTCQLCGRDILESDQQSSKGRPTASSVSRHHFNIIAVHTEKCRTTVFQQYNSRLCLDWKTQITDHLTVALARLISRKFSSCLSCTVILKIYIAPLQETYPESIYGHLSPSMAKEERLTCKTLVGRRQIAPGQQA